MVFTKRKNPFREHPDQPTKKMDDPITLTTNSTETEKEEKKPRHAGKNSYPVVKKKITHRRQVRTWTLLHPPLGRA